MTEDFLEGITQLSEEQIDQAKQNALAVLASEEFSKEGFACFYELLFGNQLPPYAETWVDAIFDSKQKDKGALVFSFRGSWKTTTISVAFTAYFIGHHPNRANLIIGASGDAANQITESIANIIDHTDAWKLTFPDIVPDKQRGWGEKGYEVKDDSVPYEEWVAKIAKRKDPTLLGLGVTSNTLIGKHPDGVLLMDDILDKENTSSVRQMQSIESTVKKTILPFIVEDERKPKGERLVTWPIVIGTPWEEDDVYQVLKDTGEFTFTEVPLLEEVGEYHPDAQYISHGKLEGHYKITWDEKNTVDTVKRYYNRSGHKDFSLMYMLDTTVQAEGQGLPFHTYPHSKINTSWPMTCGVDYASILNEKSKDFKNRSYYAQAYAFKLPDGRAVIFDGIYGRFTQAKAETQMARAEAFPGHQGTVFEADGKGEEALQVFLRNPDLTIVPMKTKGRGKAQRLEREMGPWLENGQVLISDGDTKFLRFLRKCLRKYPDYYLDPIDAVYWSLRLMPEVLHLPSSEEELPEINRTPEYENPFNSFAG